MGSETLGNVFWLISVNIIVIWPQPPNWKFTFHQMSTFYATRCISLKMLFHLPGCFSLVALESISCSWLFSSFSLESTFTIVLSDLLELTIFISIFFMLHYKFNITLILAASMIHLVRTERILPAFWFCEMVCYTWNIFYTLQTVFLQISNFFYQFPILCTRYIVCDNLEKFYLTRHVFWTVDYKKYCY